MFMFCENYGRNYTKLMQLTKKYEANVDKE
jgi:hypothetical protein